MHAYTWNETEAREALASLRTWAEDEAHHYRPGGDSLIPGFDERFVRRVFFEDAARSLNHLRIVFTISIDRAGRRWRHASVSAEKGEPPVLLVEQLLPHLGFHGRLTYGDMAVCVGQSGSPNAGAFIIVQRLEDGP